MCVYSMIMDHKMDDWYNKYWKSVPGPKYEPDSPPSWPYPLPEPTKDVEVKLPTKEELEEFRKLLERARKYDEENNQKDCELEEKKKILKDMANKLGVEIDFV